LNENLQRVYRGGDNIRRTEAEIICVEQRLVLGLSDFEGLFCIQKFSFSSGGIFLKKTEQEFERGFPVTCSGCWFKAALGQFNGVQHFQSH